MTGDRRRLRVVGVVMRKFTVLCGPGGDLLSRVLRQSTIGAEAFDGRVRDGIGSCRLAEGHQAGERQYQKSEVRNQKSEGVLSGFRLKQNWSFGLENSSGEFPDIRDQTAVYGF